MASSLYIYPTKKEYDKFYGKELEDITYECTIIDLYIDPKTQRIFVITNTSNEKERIKKRTITHIQNERFKNEYLTDDCMLVTDEKIKYKNGYLEFFPRFLRKPLLKFKVDRCVGGEIKESFIDLKNMKYDFVRDRINLLVF